MTYPAGSRKARKAATRRALQEAALRSFSSKGFAETQIGDICSAAGVAQGTFYVHFSNKEALLDELLSEFNDELVERLTQIWEGQVPRDPADVVRRIATEFFAHWTANRSLVAAYAGRMSLGLTVEHLRDGLNPPMVDFLSRTLRALALAAGGEIPNVELVTHGLLAMWLRVGMQVVFSESVSKEQATETLVQMTVGALSAVLPDVSAAFSPKE